MSSEQIEENFEAGHVCWDSKDLIKGKPTGAIRISFGVSNTWEDCKEFLSFIECYFVEKEPTQPLVSTLDMSLDSTEKIRIKNIILYPIKSCAGVEVRNTWPLCTRGLLYDREWSIIDQEKGIVLNQKMEPRLCLVQPSIDLERRTMTLTYEDTSIAIDIDFYPDDEASNQDTRVCGQKAQALVYDMDAQSGVSTWLSTVLRRPVHLARRNPNASRFERVPVPKEGDSDGKKRKTIGFANEAQFLMVSEQSMIELRSRMPPDEPKGHEWLVERFRPNIVLSSPALLPYQEDYFSKVRLGPLRLTVTGPCNRCQMICVDQRSCEMLSEPLKTLSTYRRDRAKIMFGMLMSMDDASLLPDDYDSLAPVLSVDHPVHVEIKSLGAS